MVNIYSEHQVSPCSTHSRYWSVDLLTLPSLSFLLCNGFILMGPRLHIVGRYLRHQVPDQCCNYGTNLFTSLKMFNVSRKEILLHAKVQMFILNFLTTGNEIKWNEIAIRTGDDLQKECLEADKIYQWEKILYNFSRISTFLLKQHRDWNNFIAKVIPLQI